MMLRGAGEFAFRYNCRAGINSGLPGETADARLRRIAGAVHYLDAGGIPVPEAAGLEGVLAGLRALHADDHALAAAAATIFDALYAAPGGLT